MEIKYANTHRWRKVVNDDPLALFGKSEQKKLANSLKKVSAYAINHIIAPLDEEFFKWWLPMYQERINTKDNPTNFDIKAKTLGNKSKKYQSLTLLENNEKIGGVIFSIRNDKLFFAYRTFLYEWKQSPLRASPSLYVEYLLTEYAREKGLSYISHGQDRNPYGLNSGIGLVSFKLSTGCRPQLAATYEVKTIDTNDLKVDALIFALPDPSTPYADITKAYLVTDKEGLEKWKSILSFKDKLDVEVIERS